MLKFIPIHSSVNPSNSTKYKAYHIDCIRKFICTYPSTGNLKKIQPGRLGQLDIRGTEMHNSHPVINTMPLLKWRCTEEVNTVVQVQ